MKFTLTKTTSHLLLDAEFSPFHDWRSETPDVSPWNMLFPQLPWNHTLLALLYLSCHLSGSPGLFFLCCDGKPYPFLFAIFSLHSTSTQPSWGNLIYSHSFKMLHSNSASSAETSPGLHSNLHQMEWSLSIAYYLLPQTLINRSFPLPFFPVSESGPPPKQTNCLEGTLTTPSPISYLFITKCCWFCLLHISQLCPIHLHLGTKVQDTQKVFL